MVKKTDSYRSLTTAIAVVTFVALAAFPVGAIAMPGEAIETGDLLAANDLASEGTTIVTEIMVPDPALSTSHPNLSGGVTDADGNGVDGNDPRFLDNVEIITFGDTPRPAYSPTCASCTLLRAVEFGGTSPFLPPGSGGAIFVDNDQNPTKFIFQVALINSDRVDGFGRMTGFDYFEQHQVLAAVEGAGVIGNVSGQVLFLDPDGDGDMDVWRVEHAGDSVGSFGPPPFTLDVDIVTEDLNGDGQDDIASFNDLFNVWDALTGNSADLQGQVWLPLSEDPSEPGMRSLLFNDAALDSQTVAGGPLPRTAPLAGGMGGGPVLDIPALGTWGMAFLLAALAIVGWMTLRRGGIASA